MPAPLPDAVRDLKEFFFGGEIHQSFDEVKSDPAHASLMHVLEFFVGDRAPNGCHATGFATGAAQSVDHGSVVCTMAGRLDHHVTSKSKVVAQRKELILRRVAWRVFSLRSIGKRVTRSKNMAMRIYRPRRHFELGFGRAGIPVQPAFGLLKCHVAS